jgi:hypothetical protein
MIRLQKASVAQRRVIETRYRGLRAAGFAVEVFADTGYVYMLAECR